MNLVNLVRRGSLPIRTRRWHPHHSRGLLLGGTRLRFRVWRRTQELDDELARGADPLGRDELSLRTGQLRSPQTRARLARSLRAALEIADREHPPDSAMVPLIRCAEVRDCRELILELADRMDEDRDVSAQALATISRLLADGGSPLYDTHANRSLGRVLSAAVVAMDQPPGAPAPGHRSEGA
jgi:hypothetical protein